MNKTPSSTHVLMIPSYNTGKKLQETVQEALEQWSPVWVIIDASTDNSEQEVLEIAKKNNNLIVIVLPKNVGKGGALFEGMTRAQQEGYTHILTMDADGQHPAHLIPTFMMASAENPSAMVLGKPVFGAEAPALRVNGRKVSNWWANLETLWQGIGDSLYGFRVYPITPLHKIMSKNRWMRRYDFDPEAVVRLCWAGVKPINIDAPVKYLTAEEGGISHFNYLRDNTLLTGMHIRLMFGFVIRLPKLLAQKTLMDTKYV